MFLTTKQQNKIITFKHKKKEQLYTLVCDEMKVILKFLKNKKNFRNLIKLKKKRK